MHGEPVIWEQPIVGTDGQVLGALRLHRQARKTFRWTPRWPSRLLQLAAMAIQTSRAASNCSWLPTYLLMPARPFLITEANGSIIDVNQAFTRITGYSREGWWGAIQCILTPGRQGKDYYVAMWRDLSQHGYWYGESGTAARTVKSAEIRKPSVRCATPKGMVLQYVAVFQILPFKRTGSATGAHRPLRRAHGLAQPRVVGRSHAPGHGAGAAPRPEPGGGFSGSGRIQSRQ